MPKPLEPISEFTFKQYSVLVKKILQSTPINCHTGFFENDVVRFYCWIGSQIEEYQQLFADEGHTFYGHEILSRLSHDLSTNGYVLSKRTLAYCSQLHMITKNLDPSTFNELQKFSWGQWCELIHLGKITEILQFVTKNPHSKKMTVRKLRSLLQTWKRTRKATQGEFLEFK